MATPVFCCGMECGTGGAHWRLTLSTTAPTFSTATKRTGLRSLQCNSTAATCYGLLDLPAFSRLVGRVYVRFDTLPSADTVIIGFSTGPNVTFKQSDSKLYAGVATTLGATGVAVTTGVWYRVDFDINIQTAGNDFSDAQVDGATLGQATAAGLSATQTQLSLGQRAAVTANMFFDDVLLSHTAVDYPLGAGYVLGYVPNADGTHTSTTTQIVKGTIAAPTGGGNVAGSTDTYARVNARPLLGGATDATFLVNQQTSTTTNYAEVDFEPSVESAAPRTVEVITAHRQAGTANSDTYIKLNDNGTEDTIYSRVGAAGVVTDRFARKHYATMVGGGAWTLPRFDALKARFGYANDATPDTYWRGIMIEAEYAPSGPTTHLAAGVLSQTQTAAGIAVKRAKVATSATQNQTLTGVAVKRALIAGVLSQNQTLAAALSGPTKKVAGVLSQTESLTGTIIKRAKVAGLLSQSQTLTGVIIKSAKVSGLLSQAQTLTGVAIKRAFVSGALSQSQSLTAAAIARIKVAGVLSQTATLTGTIVRHAKVSGVLSQTASLTATAIKLAKIAGVLSQTSSAAGTAIKTARVSGALDQTATITGNLEIVVETHNVSGALTQTQNLTGTVTRVVLVSGALSQTSTLTGTAIQRAKASGALSQAQTLAGSVVRTTSLSGVLSQTSSLVATAIMRAKASGLLTTAQGGLGVAIKRTFVSGLLTQAYTLTGKLANDNTVAGHLTQISSLTGTLKLRSKASGILSQNSAMTGATIRLTRVSGLLGQSALLSGTITQKHKISGNLQNLQNLQGSITRVTYVSGALVQISGFTGSLTSGSDPGPEVDFGGVVIVNHAGVDVVVGTIRNNAPIEVVIMQPEIIEVIVL